MKANPQLQQGYQDLLHYYGNLKIAPEQEFETFSKILLQDLNTTFRINKTRFFWEQTRDNFEKAAAEIEAETKIQVLKKIALRDQEAYHVMIETLALKKDPRFAKLNALVREETEQNNIFRQELVSMLPVTFLEINHRHRVLDMCAAPGSKTLQILERMQLSQQQEKAEEVIGCVVANELDFKRATMLAFQSLKMIQNYAMIINQDVTTLPDNIKFDRVLCDVPCSGDGTVRKNEMIKKGWYPKYGQKLHQLQLKILLKGLNVLNKDGILVYSTCSMNPIEDEAVVSAALDCMGGAVELVDIREKFGDFKISSGISSWKVYLKRGRKEYNQDWFETYQQAVDAKRERRLLATMFPNEKAGHPLHYTARVLPHQNDTGGFYIAVFRKKEDKVYDISLVKELELTPEEILEREKEEEKRKAKEEAKTEAKEGEEEEKIDLGHNKITLFKESNQENYEKVRDFFEIKDSITEFYILNNAKRRVLSLNKGLVKFIEESAQEKFKIINIGHRALERIRDETCPTPYRINYEFLPVIFDKIGSQKIIVDMELWKELLEDFNKNIVKLSLDQFKQGPFFVYTKEAKNLVLIGWKGKKINNLLVSKEDLITLRYLLRNKYFITE